MIISTSVVLNLGQTHPSVCQCGSKLLINYWWGILIQLALRAALAPLFVYMDYKTTYVRQNATTQQKRGQFPKQLCRSCNNSGEIATQLRKFTVWRKSFGQFVILRLPGTWRDPSANFGFAIGCAGSGYHKCGKFRSGFASHGPTCGVRKASSNRHSLILLWTLFVSTRLRPILP